MMAIATSGFILAVFVVSLFSLAGYLGQFHWLLDLTAHFKVQYLLVGIGALIFFRLKRRQIYRAGLMGLSLGCILLNLVEIVPWYIPPSTATAANVPLRLFLSNVKVQNQDYDRVIDLVRELQPDIAVFQETNTAWLAHLDTLRDRLPYRHTDPRFSGFGIAIYSALPLMNSSARFFADEGVSSLLTTITKADKTVTLVTTHPLPPLNAVFTGLRNRQLAGLGQYVQQLSTPAIVLGDLNITPWSPHYHQFTHPAALHNSRDGFGILPTWTTRLPLLFIPIDHCLVTPPIKILETRTGRDIGSDHLPLIVHLAI